jgi:predicted transcriptional regulator
VNKFNLKLSDQSRALLEELADWSDSPMSDVVRDALTLYHWQARAVRQGARLRVERGEFVAELVVPSLERMVPNPALPREVVKGPGDD